MKNQWTTWLLGGALAASLQWNLGSLGDLELGATRRRSANAVETPWRVPAIGCGAARSTPTSWS